MKLTYLVHINLPPHDWAHSLQIMHMCEAFADQGADVTLCVPRRRLSQNVDPFVYYGIDKKFVIRQLPCIDIGVGSKNPFFYWLRFLSFYISARFYLAFSDYDILYTRDLYVTPFFRNVFVERHSFPNPPKKFHEFVFRVAAGVVVLTSFIKSRIVLLGIPPEKIMVAPDAVSLKDFDDMKSPTEARATLRLPPHAHVIGYVGTLKTMGQEKGVATAIEALAHLPQDHVLYVVGGEEKDISHYRHFAHNRQLSDRVIFAGRVNHTEVALHMAACDMLVAPFPDTEHYRYFMSPLKIFEYMASRRPMVVTDLPSLREVLTDGVNALFVPPSDALGLSQAIQKLTHDRTLADHIARAAYTEVSEKYTWNKRAEGILNFIVSHENFLR